MHPFETAYNSALHHPGVAWAGALVAVALVLMRRPPLAALLLLLAGESALDAYFTGALSPIPAAAPASATVAIVFVILGDWRYFYLVERQLRPGRAMSAVASLGWALIIPIASGAGTRILPAFFADSRHVYLAYEIAFVALTLLVQIRVKRAFPDGDVRRFLLALTAFECVQYALWAAADVVILAGADWGFALRIAPNVMYYAGFVPFVLFFAPRGVRS